MRPPRVVGRATGRARRHLLGFGRAVDGGVCAERSGERRMRRHAGHRREQVLLERHQDRLGGGEAQRHAEVAEFDARSARPPVAER
eukprot:2875681-Prymnesium_polylepis.1